VTVIRSWRLWVAAFLSATVLTALTTAQSYASRRVEGVPARWERILPIQAIDWYAWALLTPAIIAAAAAIPWRRGRERVLVAVWVGIAIAFAVAHALVEVIVARQLGVVPVSMPFGTMLPARVAETLVASLIVVGLLVLSYYAVAHYRLAREREQRELALETHLARARLDVLRNQLQPHFLFNTLHTISALIGDDVQAARRVITRLGDLLRTSLDTADQHEVTLGEELAFLRHYLDIQQARFGERLETRIDVASEMHGAIVPSMLLQPLVENSIRHAVEPRAHGGTVSLHARREGPTLVVEVTDDGPGISSDADPGDGIGLANTRERLSRLYADAHEFRLENVPSGGLRVVLTLPLTWGDR
jgi:two-component system, LytTR family, sensor kinase